MSRNWEGHFNTGNDTMVKMTFVKGQDFDDVDKFLQTAKEGMYRMTDTVVAKLAKEGRKGGSASESVLFSFGKHKIFGRDGRETFSYWDSSLGGFRSRRRNAKGGGGYRLSNFKYIQKASKTGEGKVQSAVQLTSQVANLFENDAHFTKNSPVFTFGKENKKGMWRAGTTREGRHYFNEYVQAIFQSTGIAIKETEQDFERYMKRHGV